MTKTTKTEQERNENFTKTELKNLTKSELEVKKQNYN